MSFVAKIAGGLLGNALFGLIGKKKKQPDVIQPKAVTRDDAACFCPVLLLEILGRII